jgi:dTDP-4-dehydrorhamnose reductase
MKARLVWVTGAGGLIGSHIARAGAALSGSWQVRALTRPALDLTNFAAVDREFRADTPDAVIHCAALSKSPECQEKPELARLLNVEVTRHLAELASENQFVFFSSDLVFDGLKGYYNESDPVSPLTVYAETKVAAEDLVLANPRHVVIRTSLNFGRSPTGDRGLDEQLCRAWARGDTTPLFVDEFRAPIPASVTARAIWELLQRNVAGIFHLAGSERISRFDIGQVLAAHRPELNPKIRAGSLKEYRGAPRPPDTSLDCSKIQQLLSFKLPGFRECFTHSSSS